MTTAAPTRPKRNPAGNSARKPTHPKLSYNDQKAQIANTVADKILELLDRGDLPPWEKGWHNSQNSTPRNAITNRPYRGVNLWLTMIAQQICGYDDPRWLTFNQAKAAGGTVRKGETSTRIYLRKPWEPKRASNDDNTPETPQGDADQDRNKSSRPRRIWVWRIHSMFNVLQTDGCNIPPIEEEQGTTHSPIELAEAIVSGMPNPPEITYYRTANHAPHYIPARDAVAVPTKERYDRVEDWYNTIFHELVHSTGHNTRLNRFTVDQPSSGLHAYGCEELIAGMGSAMLGELAGTGHLVIERDAAYISSWRDTIKADRSIVLEAANQAQKATDHIASHLTETLAEALAEALEGDSQPPIEAQTEIPVQVQTQ